MSAEAFARLDANRMLSHQGSRALCYAPFTNLYFDRRGNVRVCCWNWLTPVGNILTDSMDKI